MKGEIKLVVQVIIVPIPNSFDLNPLEPIFLEIAEKAKLTSKTNPLNRISQLLGTSDSSSEERTKKLINQASQQYTAKYYKEYGTLKVLGMTQPVSLESIYNNVRLLPKSEIFCVKNVEELEKIYRNNSNNNRQFYSNDLTNNFVHAVAIARIYIEESVHAEIKEFNNVIRRFDEVTSYLTMFGNDDIRVEVINLLIDSAYKLSNLTEVFQNVNFKNLISELEDLKTKILNINQLEKIKKRFAKEFALIIIETWLSAFHLSPELIQLSEAEVREIDNKYYYINRLILECKEAAVKVSPKTWNEIEQRMLRA